MPTQYVDVETRTHIKQRLDSMEAAKINPAAWQRIREKDKFLADLSRTSKQLESVTPPDVQGAAKDHLKRRIGKLQEAMVHGNREVPPMPSRAEMELAPAGAVGKHTSWEQYWKTHTLDAEDKPVKVDNKRGGRGGVFEWKDLRRTYLKERERDDPDVANIEIMRPDGTNQIPLMDQRLARTYGMTIAAKANYDAVFPDHEPTHVEQMISAAAGVEEDEGGGQEGAVTETPKRRGRPPKNRA